MQSQAPTITAFAQRAANGHTRTDAVSKASIHRMSISAPRPDEILGGGLSEFSFNLIAGSPGIKIGERRDDYKGLPGGRPTRHAEPAGPAIGSPDG